MVEQLVSQVLKAQGIRVHTVTHRVKGASSTLRKLERSGTGREISDLTDLLGLRVITYFRDDVDRAATVIEKLFEIDPENSVDKGAMMDPEQFGYLSVHYIAKLDSARAVLTEYRAYAGLWFEIQVRSILQHAWAEMEHDLGYKSESAVPRTTRRSFSRLAGLLEVADDEFMRIRSDLSSLQSTVDAEIREGQRNIEIDQTSLFAYASTNRRYQALEKHISKCFGRSLANPNPTQVGNRVDDILGAGFTTIEEIDQFLGAEHELLLTFSKLWIGDDYPGALAHGIDRTRTVSSGIGFFYIALFRLALDMSRGNATAPSGKLATSMQRYNGQLQAALKEARRRIAK